jgi:hypothetical protein
MAMIDERETTRRRFNIVDIGVAILALILIPAAYGSYLLFRNPTPELVAVTPNRLYQGNQLKVTITGRDLRPFMRVSFNNVQGRSFLIASPSSAQVDLPDLDPGVFDVVLYDYRQEVARLPKALTIMSRPAENVVTVEVEGIFTGLTDADAAAIKPGAKLPATGGGAEVVAVATMAPGALQIRFGDTLLRIPTDQRVLPATLRVPCVTSAKPDGMLQCLSVATQVTTPVAPEAVVDYPGARGWVRYQIRSIHAAPASAIVTARVQFTATPELLRHMKAGDIDVGAGSSAISRRARIVSLGDSHPIAGGQAIVATVRIPADRSGNDWTYNGTVVKAGAPLTIETPTYIVQGEILDTGPAVESPPQP